MSEEQGQQPGDGSDDAAPALGSWLREAREAAGLGTEAVAAALHLDPEIVAALETEAFDTLGAPVFVKGHVRALANHLGLDAGEAIRRYEATAGESGVRPPDLVVQYQRPIRRNRLAPAIVVAVIALLTIALVTVFLLWPDRGAATGEPEAEGAPAAAGAAAGAREPETDVAPTATEPASASLDAPPGGATGESEFAARLAEARARSAANATRTPEPVVERPAAAAAGLVLQFSGECWFEVRDANGRRLATGTAAPGETRNLDGARPLSVTLGVADSVSVTLDGVRVEIPAESRRGRSARLTLR